MSFAADCKLSSLGCFTAENAAVSLKSKNRKVFDHITKIHNLIYLID